MTTRSTTQSARSSVLNTLHIFLEMEWEMFGGILRRIVLLTQHHDADEVADDSEAACDDGEGPTDD